MTDPQLIVAFALAAVTLALAAWSFERYRTRRQNARLGYETDRTWEVFRYGAESIQGWERRCDASMRASHRRRGIGS